MIGFGLDDADLDELQGRRAGVVSRGIAFSIDAVVVIAGVPAVLWGIGIAKGILTFSKPEYPDLPDIVDATITLVWSVGYFTVLWGFVGRTAGQALMGLRVIGRTTSRVGFIRSWWRAVVMYCTLLIVPLWLALSRSRLALHDLAAGTQVIYDRARKETELDLTLGARNHEIGVDGT